MMIVQKYRTKPTADPLSLVVEAFQMTKARRWDNSDWPSWLHEAWNKEPGEGCLWIDASDPARERLALGTPEGVSKITWGDWIIKGVKGEISPCASDIFAARYEPMAKGDAR
jgi:hypothetical protein